MINGWGRIDSSGGGEGTGGWAGNVHETVILTLAQKRAHIPLR